MSESELTELDKLYDVLMPVLTEAAIGNFDTLVDIDPDRTGKANEIAMGVAVLLETIREKIAQLEEANAQLAEAHSRSVSIVDEVLKKSLEL